MIKILTSKQAPHRASIFAGTQEVLDIEAAIIAHGEDNTNILFVEGEKLIAWQIHDGRKWKKALRADITSMNLGLMPKIIAKAEARAAKQPTPVQQQQAKPRRADRRSIMQAAWQFARAAAAKFGGKASDFFALSLKQAWAIAL